MARIMGIDYGKKRVGIAVTDPLKIIAGGLTTVSTEEAIKFLTAYFLKEPVETIVVGLPKNLDNTPTDATAGAERFIAELKNTFPSIPVQTVDERFTSKMAMQRMIASGIKKKARQDKALLDKTSATLILETYLQQQV
jgi:putative Holliday junction resolvase